MPHSGLINKTTYLEYLQCPKNIWLKLHRPDLHSLFQLSEFEKSLLVKGNLVESWAQKLFPGGVALEPFGENALTITLQHIGQKTPVLFQPTFVFDAFLARCDVLEYDPAADQWNLYEIKGKNSMEENSQEIDHVEDAAFQVIVLQENGIRLGKISIVHLNKEYTRGEDIDVKSLLTIEDITEKIKEREPSTREKMAKAKAALLQDDESALSCQCIYAGRNSHCTTFQYSHQHVPEYSIHDIARIGVSKKKLEKLVDQGIFDLNDIPEGFELSEIQQNQVTAHRLQRPIIDSSAINKELSGLSYPLYFLDYETYAPAIPLYKGFRPYQQVPFQFSLHIAFDPLTDPIHLECLHVLATDPSPIIIQKLQEYIGPSGHIIVWNKSFEQKINAELAERHPEHKAFVDGINSRIYDLMDIFKKQMHVHPGFRGKTSIKKVLPVLVPELSYKELEIQEGATASQRWFDMIFGTMPEEERLRNAEHLRKYCGLDTYAMYAIWKHLMGNYALPQTLEVQESPNET